MREAILIPIVLGVFMGVQSTPECHPKHVTGCVNEFWKNIEMSDEPETAGEFVGFLFALIAREKVIGFEKMCSAHKSFAACLGDQAEACMEPSSLQRIFEIGLPDANTYTTTYHFMGAECGRHKKVFVDNLDCIMDVLTAGEHNRNVNDVCKPALQMELGHDPRNICKAHQNFVLCSSSPYKKCGGMVSDALCDVSFEATEYRVHLAECSFTCTPLEGEVAFNEESYLNPFMLFSEPLNNIETIVNSVEPNRRRHCKKSKLKKCQKQLWKDLGVPKDVEEAMDFINYLNKIIMRKKLQGFNGICRSWKKMERCLDHQAKACVNMDSVEKIFGTSKQDAIIYTVAYWLVVAECGRDYDAISSNFNCLLREGTKPKANQTVYGICIPKLIICLTKKPDQYCGCYNKYFSCIARIFSSCGSNAVYAECDLLAAGYKSILTDCQFSCKKGPATTCNSDHFERCTSMFSRNLGVPRWVKTADNFMQFLVQWGVEKGLPGFQKLCTTYKNLQKCLGTQTESCMNVGNLMKLGLSEADASGYTYVYHQLFSECGKNYHGVVKYGECFIKTVTNPHYNHTVNKVCLPRLMQQLRDHPSQYCRIWQSYLNCLINPYKRNCAKEGQNVVCDITREGLKPFLPNGSSCQLRCGTQESEEEKDTEEHSHQVENGCNRAQFDRCAQIYPRDLPLPGWVKSSDDFMKYLLQYSIEKGLNGFKHLCKTHKSLQQCFGTQAESCMNVGNLVKFGVSEADAGGWTYIYHQLNSECGKNYNGVIKYGDCFIKTVINPQYNQTVYGVCLPRLMENLKDHPSQYCRTWQQYLNCVVGPYKKTCVKEGQHVVCDMTREGLQALLPKNSSCRLKCGRMEEEETEEDEEEFEFYDL